MLIRHHGNGVVCAPLYAVALLVGAAFAFGADTQPATAPVEPIRLKVPEEQAALDKLMARFTGTPEIKVQVAQRQKTTLMQVAGKLKVADPESKSVATMSITVDEATGRVTQINANAFALRDDEIKVLAPFAELRSLLMWHNNLPDKAAKLADYSGAGLADLVGLTKLETVVFAGSGGFNEQGMAAAARLPALQRLQVFHTGVTDAGVAALKQSATLEEISIGPMWAQRITNKSLEALADCPKLARVRITESWLAWDDGLKHLVKRKDTLKEVDLGACLIDPADVAKLKEASPDVTVKWDEKGAGKALAGSAWFRSLAGKWIPKDLIEKAIKESGADVKP